MVGENEKEEDTPQDYSTILIKRRGDLHNSDDKNKGVWNSYTTISIPTQVDINDFLLHAAEEKLFLCVCLCPMGGGWRERQIVLDREIEALLWETD